MDRGTEDIVPTPRRARRVPATVFMLVLCACNPAPGQDDQPEGRTANADSTIAPPAGGRSADPGGQSDATQPDATQPDSDAATGWTVGSTAVEREVTGAALLRSARAARHDGFDRIVLDFGSDAVPGYQIEYVDRPVRQCGSGEAVPLAGDAWLLVRVQPANAHTEAGEPTVRPRELSIGLPTLLELKLICDFEAVVEWVAAVSSPERYRAFTLTSPNRLVVDIRHR